MSGQPLVRLVDAGFSTSGSVILRGVDLAVEAGDIVGISGPNGAGKTTLLRLLATLLRPTSGNGAVLGIDTGARPQDLVRARRQTALVGHFPALWPELTLRENVNPSGRAAAWTHGWRPPQRRRVGGEWRG